jgi:hypothetical protein
MLDSLKETEMATRPFSRHSPTLFVAPQAVMAS